MQAHELELQGEYGESKSKSKGRALLELATSGSWASGDVSHSGWAAPKNAKSWWDETKVNSKAWEPAISFSDDWTFTLRMSDHGMDDEQIGAWCRWFRGYMKPYTRKSSFVAREVDFSRNGLTEKGVQLVLRTLSQCGVAIRILKVHHNKLEEAGVLESLIHEGDVREVHLSHNFLRTSAAVQLIAAAASAKDSDGVNLYPWRAEKGSVVPLWLRMEHNNIDYDAVERNIDHRWHGIRRHGRLICEAEATCCKPWGCCACDQAPPVHVPYLWNQRACA